MYFWSREVPPRGDRPGVRFAVTSRGDAHAAPESGDFDLGGRSGGSREDVERHRSLLARDFGVARDRLLFLNQCHSAHVVEADGPWDGRAPDADAVVTRRDDLALAALTADCVPVLLADAAAGVIAAVHAGRPGLRSRVVVRAVERMRAAGASTIEAVVGPSVCGRCYEVPADMRDDVAAVSPVSATVSWSGTPALDIAAGVVDQLRRQDVDVTWVPGCTRETPELYSYRRDGTTSRFAGLVRLVPLGVDHEKRVLTA